jgi:hypothetical protein
MAKSPLRRFIKMRTRTVACLRVCLSIVLMLLVISPALSQRARFDPDGSFWIHGDKPADFSDFDSINLNAKRRRYLNSPGLMAGTTRYRFKTLVVKRDNFNFTTMTVRGISYSFAGKFLKGGVYGAGELDEETPVLEGTLTKFSGGKKVAEANLKFVYFGGT